MRINLSKLILLSFRLMKSRRTWQNVFHNQRRAISEANKTTKVILYTPGMLGLVSLAMLSGASGPPIQHKLLLHWVKYNHATSLKTAYVVLHRLERQGFLSIERQPNCNRIHLTVQGQLWLKVFEKGLKKRIKLG